MSDDKPEWMRWDSDKAAKLIGCLVLVGITKTHPDGEVFERIELYGVVLSTDERAGIAIEVHGERQRGETFWLPPSPNVFEKAAPGQYRLRSTGETVSDPDYLVSWTYTPPRNA